MQVLYFAWLRQRLGRAGEPVSPPPEVTDVAALIVWLQSLSPAHAAALAQPETLRAAVNQVHAGFETAIAAGDEIALFPPVCGG